MSRTKIKKELTRDYTDSSPNPKIKCEFYPQEFPHHELFQCGICSAVLEEDAFTDHVRSHYHPPVKCEAEEETEEIKPSLIDIALPEIDIPDIPLVKDKEPTNERTFPFPIVDYQENMTKGNVKSNVIYTCLNPDNLYYKCDKCSFTASKQTVLIEHKKSHEKNVLKCSKCAFSTSSPQMYAMHCRRHRKRPIADVEPIEIKPENVF